MNGTRNVSRATFPRDAESAILKQNYHENVILMSVDGVLKIVSILVCLGASVVQLRSAECSGGAGAVGAGVSLAAAALLATLFSVSALSISNYAPTGWLYADIIVTSVIGVALFVSAVMGLVACETRGATELILGVVGIVNAGVVVSSAAVTYASVSRRADAYRRARAVRSPPPAADTDV